MNTCAHGTPDDKECMLCIREGENKRSPEEDKPKPDEGGPRWGGDEPDPGYGDWTG